MRRILVYLVVVLAVLSVDAASIPDELLNSMSFRLVGPFRGGRVTAVTGVSGDPMTYYMGSTGGGVWKTNNAGVSWRNVSDAVREFDPVEEARIMGQVDPGLAVAGTLSVGDVTWYVDPLSKSWVTILLASREQVVEVVPVQK